MRLLPALLISICSALSAAQQQPTPKQCWKEDLEASKTPYFIGNGFTCCNNIWLEHPMKPKSSHWRKCMMRSEMNEDNDIPQTMWDIYMCEISSASDGKISKNSSYSDFMGFYLKNYPQDLKEKLLSRNPICEVDVNSTNVAAKARKFGLCFMKEEESLCLELAGIKPIPPPSGIEEIQVCEPIESLKKPNHDFQTFAQPCCKGEELPYPLFEMLMDFSRFDIDQEVEVCSDKYKTKLRELNHPLGSSQEPFTMCQVACVHEADGLSKNYNTNFNDLINFKLKAVSNKTKSALISMIQKYQPTFVMLESDAKMPMEDAANAISKLDESKQILNYCKFQYEATAEVYRALYEHCFNADYGKQFKDDIIKSST